MTTNRVAKFMAAQSTVTIDGPKLAEPSVDWTLVKDAKLFAWAKVDAAAWDVSVRSDRLRARMFDLACELTYRGLARFRALGTLISREEYDRAPYTSTGTQLVRRLEGENRTGVPVATRVLEIVTKRLAAEGL